ncbi:hypothetical protein [Iningainema tapete]|uniref:Uncharacterized protein n=1 Tax=Iningainema tapete BLCC-T55 TaxID=2748662 RepID=A0A8J7C5K1_9CYAN|nr:hypothetical protein [Iningainema tapete]MBD2773189.1 hypothetical protein [Iningainema tapete BLCC-T55]
MQQTEITPKPSGKSTKFYLHLANWSEFFTWFSIGIAVSFLCQLVPKFFLLYPLGFVFAIGYFIVSFSTNKQGNLLRILAVISSLIGFWNVFYLYRDSITTAVTIITVLLAMGGAFVWYNFHSER